MSDKSEASADVRRRSGPPGAWWPPKATGRIAPLVRHHRHDILVFAADQGKKGGGLLGIVLAQKSSPKSFERQDGIGLVQHHQIHFFHTGKMIAEIRVKPEKFIGGGRPVKQDRHIQIAAGLNPPVPSRAKHGGGDHSGEPPPNKFPGAPNPPPSRNAWWLSQP